MWVCVKDKIVPRGLGSRIAFRFSSCLFIFMWHSPSWPFVCKCNQRGISVAWHPNGVSRWTGCLLTQSPTHNTGCCFRCCSCHHSPTPVYWCVSLSLSLSLSLSERLALKPLKLHRLSLCGLRCEQQKCDRTLGAPPPFSPQSAPGQRSSADGYGSQYTLYFQKKNERERGYL